MALVLPAPLAHTLRFDQPQLLPKKNNNLRLVLNAYGRHAVVEWLRCSISCCWAFDLPFCYQFSLLCLKGHLLVSAPAGGRNLRANYYCCCRWTRHAFCAAINIFYYTCFYLLLLLALVLPGQLLIGSSKIHCLAFKLQLFAVKMVINIESVGHSRLYLFSAIYPSPVRLLWAGHYKKNPFMCSPVDTMAPLGGLTLTKLAGFNDKQRIRPKATLTSF